MQDREGQKPPVCRRLFADDLGPADPGAQDNLFNEIKEEITRELDEACKKYNFDFRAEVPLEGDYQWERIEPQPRVLKPGGEQPPPQAPAEPKDDVPPKPQEPPSL